MNPSNPFQKIQAVGLDNPFANIDGPSKASFVDSANKPNFKDLLSGMVQETEKTLGEPDRLMMQAMHGGKVDIHDVMIANAKADIAVNVVSQVVTKVIQAYERVQQIQV